MRFQSFGRFLFTMKQMNVAILGATSHIAKGLIYRFLKSDVFYLHLYARSSKKIHGFLGTLNTVAVKDCACHEGYEEFHNSSYDAVINCVGAGTLTKLQGDYTKYFTITEEYDNLAISYLRKRDPAAIYISFSSGAVYGSGFSSPANEYTANCIHVNQLEKKDFYSIARLNAEAKHRAFEDLNIVDLRVFSYFSRFFDPTDDYFITDVINCILENRTLITGSSTFVRDFVHPKDLFSLIIRCMDAAVHSRKINGAFDAISSQPVEKEEMLAFFAKKYNLQYVIDPSLTHASATGAKSFYYSTYRNAASIGHSPAFSSMDALADESKHIFLKPE